MYFLKHNYMILFIIILLCILMSKYILVKTQKEMFSLLKNKNNKNNKNNKKNNSTNQDSN